MDTNRLQWLGQAEELMALLLVIDGDRNILRATSAHSLPRRG